MKKTTFTCLLKVLPGRPDRIEKTGYAFEHSAHPGHVFIAAYGTAFHRPSGTVRMSNQWRIYDLASGFPLPIGVTHTRTDAIERAVAYLHTTAPEHLEAWRQQRLTARATTLLSLT